VIGNVIRYGPWKVPGPGSESEVYCNIWSWRQGKGYNVIGPL
jgi:hypothetical protein